MRNYMEMFMKVVQDQCQLKIIQKAMALRSHTCESPWHKRMNLTCLATIVLGSQRFCLAFFRPHKICNFLFKSSSILWTASVAKLFLKLWFLCASLFLFSQSFPWLLPRIPATQVCISISQNLLYFQGVHVVLGKFPASVNYQISYPLYLCFLLKWKFANRISNFSWQLLPAPRLPPSKDFLPNI